MKIPASLRLFNAIMAFTAMMFFSPWLYAHHSVAEFDTTQTLTIHGIVKEVWYNNPHVRYYVTVTDDNGEDVVWDVHTSSVNVLIRRGWTRDAIKVGDEVFMTGSPTREGEPRLLIHTVELADGTRVSTRRSDVDK